MTASLDQAERTTGVPARRRGKRAGQSESRLAFYLLIPSAIFLFLVVGIPILLALWQSFQSNSRFGTARFVGLENYGRAFGSADFWASLLTTVKITAVAVSLELLIGLMMALIMNKAFAGRGLVRTSVLVPWAIPTVVTALLWAWMYQPVGGIVNAVTGLDVIWTGSPTPAFWAIVIADVWKTTPFIGLLLLAGLQIIPNDIYEAAKVDGASAWQRFTRVTLPLLKNAIVVAVLFRMLDTLRMFDLPWVLTHGANNTTTLSIFAYQQAIAQVNTSYGAALSMITFAFIMLCAFLFMRLLGANVAQSQAREAKR